MRYFGVNKRVVVERKDYVGPSKKRDLEKVIKKKYLKQVFEDIL